VHLTDYHAKYYAYELTRRYAPDDAGKLVGAVASAQVDLNPHQVDAALFAFSSPFSKGALLADEVGLGKTIEAGLVISQRWAERKRRILVITPSNLRKQWHQELAEKFFLPSFILESKPYNAAIRSGNFKPFERANEIVICSYQFARSKAVDVRGTPWDLVVIDEAHRLRNVYKPSNVVANTLKMALAPFHKLLLTATPLQNSLLELFGLVSIIDEHAFGDLKSFRERYSKLDQDQVFAQLKERLKPVCHRTLRRQVAPYVSYTKRFPIIEEFLPSEGEDELYNLVSEYLRRPNLQALPASQRTLMTLVLRKLLASSTFAIAGALRSMSDRLKRQLSRGEPKETLEETLNEDYEALDETADEWEDEEPAAALNDADRKAIQQEIDDLDRFTRLAMSIHHNAKGQALLKALKVAFKKAAEFGAQEKAIIFTESRRTQDYLLRLLADSDYADGIVLFNGSNTDERSKRIYAEWLDQSDGSDRVTGSRTADMRSALVDYFRDKGRIMIATEAGAEGINLQFCSLVVNYDLPWNPQRIEQRIGRCHRYGQKHDVVVVNFLNRKNEADQRVFQLLSEKFKLFDGVFGVSDEVLGAIESGIDFEKRISDIYQRCRQPDEIRQAFDQLQLELSFEIDQQMAQTRRKLLENFDEEVHEKLKLRKASTDAELDRFERLLMQLTRYELKDHAAFSGNGTFRLNSVPEGLDPALAPLGDYELPRRTSEAHLYRVNHPLAEWLIGRAKSRALDPVEVTLDYSGHVGRVSLLDPLRGKSGWLSVSLLTSQSGEHGEDHLIACGVEDGDWSLDSDQIERILRLSAKVGPQAVMPEVISVRLEKLRKEREVETVKGIGERNARFFEAEADKLDGWADDLKVGLEREIKEIDRQIKDARRAATAAVSLEEKLAAQKRTKSLEAERNRKRRSLFEAQDEIDKQRAKLIEEVEAKLRHEITKTSLFAVRWVLV